MFDGNTCSLLFISGLLCGILPVEGGAVFGRTDLCPLVAGVTGAGVEFQVVQGRRRQTDMPQFHRTHTSPGHLQKVCVHQFKEIVHSEITVNLLQGFTNFFVSRIL